MSGNAELAGAPASVASPAKSWTVAVIGNPNTGKTTLFNALTGLRQHVGNYPGVTVERKTGSCRLDAETTVQLVDLPGTYSLAARSPDEMIAVDVLLGQQKGASKVDAILAVADASNPERNFYLVSQLCELNLPVLLVLNMMDVAEQKGIRIDLARLGEALGTPVAGVSASKGRGIGALRAALKAVLAHPQPPQGKLPEFSEPLLLEAGQLAVELSADVSKTGRSVTQPEAFRILVDKGGFAERRLAEALGTGFGESLEQRRSRASSNPLPAEEVRVRYAWVRHLLSQAIQRPASPPPSRSDQIDKVVTHRFIGPVIFAGLMALVFQSIFSWSKPLMKGVGGLFDALGGYVGANMAEGALRSLICDGVIAGVGGVLSFLPQIAILFFFIAVLEDCGYMARAAFLMDRFFARVGLSGKAFIPLLSSFACSVPGIMAARTIENSRERLTTILLAPLMSCSARLPVYYLIIDAFVPARNYLGGWVSLRVAVFMAMYALGMVLAVPIAWLLKKTVIKGETPPFLIELPSYKMPDWRTVLLRVTNRSKEFISRAGTVILAVTILVWALAYFPHSKEIGERYNQKRAAAQTELPADEAQAAVAALNKEESGEYLRTSYFGTIGHGLEGVFEPLGWDWRISMAAMASFPAREVVIAVMGTIFNAGTDEGEDTSGLQNAMRAATWEGTSKPLFTLPVALSIIVFFALCMQCGATLATIKGETNSWRWPLFAFAYLTALAYAGAWITFHAASALGWS